MTDSLQLITIITIIVIFVFLIPRRREKFDVLGLAAGQRKFLDKCWTDCRRKWTGSTYDSQFNFLCDVNCRNEEIRRFVNHGPDISTKEHSRYGSCDTSNDKAYCSCMVDVDEWCENKYCAYSKIPGCMRECKRINSYNCDSGMLYSGQL